MNNYNSGTGVVYSKHNTYYDFEQNYQSISQMSSLLQKPTVTNQNNEFAQDVLNVNQQQRQKEKRAIPNGMELNDEDDAIDTSDEQDNENPYIHNFNRKNFYKKIKVQNKPVYQCKICKKYSNTDGGMYQHYTRFHSKKVVVKKMWEEIQNLRQEAVNLKQQYVLDNYALIAQVKELQIQVEEMTKQLHKPGKKKDWALVKLMTTARIDEIKSNKDKRYAAYNFNIFDKERMKSFSRELGDEKFIGLIVDPPYNNTGLAFSYSTVIDELILGIDFESIQEKGYMWLYTTKKKVPLGIELFRRHKYMYIDMIIWEKVDQNGEPDGSVGYYYEHQFEVCLVGRKLGKKVFNDDNFHVYPDIIRAQRGIASEKPEILKAHIKNFLGESKGKLGDLFGRDNNICDGWVTIGNQISKELLRPLKEGKLV